MNVFKRLKEIFIPVNQPIHFPRLYFIPDTYEVDAPRRSANDPSYRPPAVPEQFRTSSTIEKLKRESFIQGYIRRRKEAIRQTLHQAIPLARLILWGALKAFGRSVVRCLARWVFMPLSVAACLSVPSIYPMGLPL
jgi:hypothetical protein